MEEAGQNESDATLVTSHEYQLITPVQYGRANGTFAMATFVQLRAPTSRNRRECALLKEAFFLAIPKAEAIEGAKKSQTEAPVERKIAGSDIIALIGQSRDASLPDVIETGVSLLLNQTAFLDGDQKLTKPLLEAMSYDDIEGMVGEYLRVFLLKSALKGARPT